MVSARRTVLHTFGSEADSHEKNRDTKKFGYPGGGMHAYDAQLKNANLRFLDKSWLPIHAD